MLNGRIDKPGDARRLGRAPDEGRGVRGRVARGGARLAAARRAERARRRREGTDAVRRAGAGTRRSLAALHRPRRRHLLRCACRTASGQRGGPAFAYRLRVAQPGPPDFRLRLSADAVNLTRGGQAKLTIQAERLGGFTEPIALSVEGLPSGVTAKNMPGRGEAEHCGHRFHCRREGTRSRPARDRIAARRWSARPR